MSAGSQSDELVSCVDVAPQGIRPAQSGLLSSGDSKDYRERVPAMSAKERNRQAQRAYRERQKDRQRATEQQVEELTERVSVLHRENEVLESALQAARNRSEQGQAIAGVEEVSAPAVVLRLGGLPPQIQLSSHDLAALTMEALADIWKRLVQALRPCILEAERDPGGRLGKRAEAVAGEACTLMWALMDHDAQLMEDFMHTNLDAPGLPPTSCAIAQPAIMESLRLTAQQEALLLETRDALLSNLQALMAERNAFCQQLNGIVDVEEHPGGAVSNYVAISEIVKQMQERVNAMRACHSYYISHAFTQILTPYQVAHFIVQSYPFGPDLMGLLTALAERQPGGAEAFALPPSGQPSSSSGPVRPGEWRIAMTLPISVIRQRI